MDDIVRRKLAERLRDARQQRGLSQSFVAQRLGVPRPAISHIESGQRRVEAVELAILAEMYGRTVSYFTMPTEPKVERLIRAIADMSDADRDEVLAFVEHLKKSR